MWNLRKVSTFRHLRKGYLQVVKGENETFSEERGIEIKVTLLNGNEYVGTIYTEWVTDGRGRAGLVEMIVFPL